MNIFKEMKCGICGGSFTRDSEMIIQEKGKPGCRRKIKVCNGCGDTPFSAEQYMAQKFKSSHND
jgi:hypothetical protein